MNKTVCCLFACLFVSAVHAQTAPKVVFTGDNFAYAWQQNTHFTANHNWIGAAVPVQCCSGGGSINVEAEFQKNVVSQHPAFVHILTGGSDIGDISDAIPPGVAWHQYENALVAMVDMAAKANIKVILGNIPWDDTDPGGNGDDAVNTQLFNAWLASYGAANNIPVVNYHDALCQCVGSTIPNDTFADAFLVQSPSFTGPNDAGYALMTDMAQIAVQTYGLTIKSGYLSDVETRAPGLDSGEPLPSQVNKVEEGATVQFTPRAKWSDGVVRPLLNQDFNGLKGTWFSTNPAVVYVNQQGQAFAYSAGTAKIWFLSASGVYFSPWTMTVTEVYPDFNI